MCIFEIEFVIIYTSFTELSYSVKSVFCLKSSFQWILLVLEYVYKISKQSAFLQYHIIICEKITNTHQHW